MADIDSRGDKTPKKSSSSAAAPLYLLYVSNLLSCWGDRMWEFVVPLAFLAIYPESLIPVSIFEISSYFTTFAFGSYIGNWIDRGDRKRVMSICLVLQNLTCALSGLGIVVLLYLEGDTSGRSFRWPFASFWSFFVLLICTILNAISFLMSMGTFVAVKRVWTPVLSSVSGTSLARINSVIHAIDMGCDVAAPLAMSFLLRWNVFLAVVIVAAWNVVSFFPEFASFFHLYDSVPELRVAANEEKKKKEVQENVFVILKKGMKTYMEQDTFLASVSYVMLYFTCLSSHDLILAYFKHLDIDTRAIGVFKAASAIFGFAASLLAPLFVQCVGLIGGGTVTIIIQIACLWIGVLSYSIGFLHGGSDIAFYVFMGSIVSSRIGLWGFDLSHEQIQQVGVKADVQGLVGGVEAGLCDLANMMVYVVSLIAASPKYFPALVVVSLLCVTSSAFVYYIWARSENAKTVLELSKKKE